MVAAQTDSAGEKETGRVEAFSDGVFAIAITLLVLDLKVPNASAAARLSGQLAKQWPAYLAFVISFSFIGVMWINITGSSPTSVERTTRSLSSTVCC
jgi:uncharacterized membrane protein